MRKLGIPTVTDRVIQQALTQVLTPIFDPGFSESSYGFRPGRSAHDAVRQALKYQQEGKQWVVDLDLKQFFDEVNHDVLMARIGRKVKDKRIKRLINAYLKAGVVCPDGEHPTDKGTPQGGPLSPFLSNVLLDDLDKELERRGHSFCRYADDCNIYVRSQKAGETSHGLGHRIYREGSETEGEPEEERGSASVEADLSGVHLHQGPRSDAHTHTGKQSG